MVSSEIPGKCQNVVMEAYWHGNIKGCLWYIMVFPYGSAGKESACNAGDLGLILGFDPCVGKIPWRRERLPTLVFWPGEFHGLYSPWGCRECNTTEQLSLSLSRCIWEKKTVQTAWNLHTCIHSLYMYIYLSYIYIYIYTYIKYTEKC